MCIFFKCLVHNYVLNLPFVRNTRSVMVEAWQLVYNLGTSVLGNLLGRLDAGCVRAKAILIYQFIAR